MHYMHLRGLIIFPLIILCPIVEFVHLCGFSGAKTKPDLFTTPRHMEGWLNGRFTKVPRNVET
jgi:hypothetical protein